MRPGGADVMSKRPNGLHYIVWAAPPCEKRWVLQLAAAVFGTRPAVEKLPILCKLAASRIANRSFSKDGPRAVAPFSERVTSPFTSVKRGVEL
jgi:hypothetical protein